MTKEKNKEHPTREEMLKQFWLYMIHPITGYGALYDRDKRIGTVKRESKDKGPFK